MTAPPPYSAWRTSPRTSTPSQSKLSANQAALPKLPVPPLQSTLSKILQSTAALGTPAELKELEAKVREFEREGGEGSRLQERLSERRESDGMRNWLSEWWDMDGYMSYRDSVVGNVSYYYGFNKLPQSPARSSQDKADPAYVAATITTTALQFRKLISSGLLEPEPAGKAGGELCMESYKWAFNACRIPATPSDYATKIEETSSLAQHITVIRQGRFWEVSTVSEDGKEVGVDGFKKAFHEIMAQDVGRAKGKEVGVLTGVNRDTWSDARAFLLSRTSGSSPNAATLHSIESSAFVIAFDESSPEPAFSPTTGWKGMIEFSKRLWTGGDEGGNRWWDKPLQWIVFANGESGFVGEHSCMDGTPTARLNSFLSARLLSTESVPGTDSSFSSASITPHLLPLEINTEVEKLIGAAQGEFESHAGSYDVQYSRYSKYGKDGIKAMGFSPDAWTQMLFQLAYYKTHGHSCGTYEAAQTRKFQLGRTETIRVTTVESVEFVKAIVDGKLGDGEKKKLFQKATKKQGADAREAADGLGIDRHLFGLRKVRQAGEEAGTHLLDDPLLKRSSTWNMSTSQIYIREAPSYGWGPVVEDGYGLPYMIHPECLQFTVTSKKAMPSAKFLKNLEWAADEVWELMERCKEAEAKAGAKL
ncbi:hypothetical protein P7C70_g58, partial [Phenoliferia sp. Uapishka_3]